MEPSEDGTFPVCGTQNKKEIQEEENERLVMLIYLN